MFRLIGISADFDPVHKGHEKLINEALKIASKEDKKVVVYLNKGYSANHAHFSQILKPAVKWHLH